MLVNNFNGWMIIVLRAFTHLHDVISINCHNLLTPILWLLTFSSVSQRELREAIKDEGTHHGIVNKS